MNSKEFAGRLKKFLARNADPHAAAGAKAYMRNQFEYFGMPTPVRRKLVREFLEKNDVPAGRQLPALIKLLWKQPQRECQYVGMEILEKRIGELSKKDLALFEYMITHKSWWDTVDFISPKLLGPFLRLHPELVRPVTQAWMRSGNIWLVRATLLFQMKYRAQADEQLLYALIRQCMHEKEFFIRKAIGWALSEHSKTFPASVKRFVKENFSTLSPLSRKEALRQFR